MGVYENNVGSKEEIQHIIEIQRREHMIFFSYYSTKTSGMSRDKKKKENF